MLTRRAWWFLFWVMFVTVNAVAWIGYYSPLLALLGMTLLIWFVGEWIIFAYRFRATSGRIRIDRKLIQGDRIVPTLWAGVECKVELELRLDHGCKSRLPCVAASDALPTAKRPLTGKHTCVGQLRDGEPLTIEYSWRPKSLGTVRFEGVELLITDLGGLFYRRVFLRVVEEYLIMPPLVKEDGSHRSVKRINTLPPPGIHRFRRAGSGDELLDLRDYIPGDPPKMIAWKASARRDRLITKEFESDVPVRCQLFLDHSSGMRVGPHSKTTLVRMASLGSAIAQAAAANRDLVGMTTFDDDNYQVISPARTRTHILSMLKKLAEICGETRIITENQPRILQKYAYAYAQDYYPELLTKEVNSRPLGLFWKPLLDSKWSRLLIITVILQYFFFSYSMLDASVRIAESMITIRSFEDLIPLLGIVWLIMFLPNHVTLIFWFLFGVRGFLPPRSRELSVRKQLAALYASQDGDEPAMIERYIHDDAIFVERTRQFLQLHRVSVPETVKDGLEAEKQHLNADKIQVLAVALRRAVGMARDNELYIIMTDLIELKDELDPILQVVRMARGRGHHVLFLLPNRADQDPESKDDDPEIDAESDFGRRLPKRSPMQEMIDHYLENQAIEAAANLRRELVCAGAHLLEISERTTIPWVMDRLDRLRGVRTRR